ncbi:hypothetical protein ACIA8C_13565 [Nocardia sp. NPDC051321]|uniref:hypothetical protein n=1 Tax=Nocardia sp. NPDC051321 TaxID=3364323 RepID=UPI00379D70FD
MIPTDQLTDPAVRAFATAVNSDDPSALHGTRTPDATMSDDGSAEDLHQRKWRFTVDGGQVARFDTGQA